MSQGIVIPDESVPHKQGNVWPAAITVAIALQAALVLIMVAVSSRDPSFALEPDYYAEAVRWDAHAAERDASRALGWSGRLALSPAGEAPGRSLSLELSDASGRPVVGAEPHVVAFHQARAGVREEWTLGPVEGRPGLYTAIVRPHRPGLWELRVRVQRGADTFLETYVLPVSSERATGTVESVR